MFYSLSGSQYIAAKASKKDKHLNKKIIICAYVIRKTFRAELIQPAFLLHRFIIRLIHYFVVTVIIIIIIVVTCPGFRD
jgi:hypothetical protein